MLAAVLHEDVSSLSLEEVEKPKPRRGEVLVRVAAAGMCHTDLHVIKGEVKFPRPAVLGHEISGIVEEVGEGVSNVEVGDRVVCPFIMPCGTCYYCLRGMDNLCESFFKLNRLQGKLYDGETRLYKSDGTPIWMYSMAGFAEYSVTPATAAFKLPKDAPLYEAAILGCAVFTAYGALKNSAGLRSAESMAVVGVGGIGSSLILLSRIMGAYPIIAIDVRDEKLKLAKRLGAMYVINSMEEDPVKETQSITDGRGVDAAFEALGTPQTVNVTLSLVRDGGRAVLIGIAPVGTQASFEISRAVRRELKILGSYGARTRIDMPELLKLVEGGILRPETLVSKSYPLDEVNKAFDALSKGEVLARSIVKIS